MRCLARETRKFRVCAGVLQGLGPRDGIFAGFVFILCVDAGGACVVARARHVATDRGDLVLLTERVAADRGDLVLLTKRARMARSLSAHTVHSFIY